MRTADKIWPDLENIFAYCQISEKNKGICRIEDLASVLDIHWKDLLNGLYQLECDGVLKHAVSDLDSGAYLVIWPTNPEEEEGDEDAGAASREDV